MFIYIYCLPWYVLLCIIPVIALIYFLYRRLVPVNGIGRDHCLFMCFFIVWLLATLDYTLFSRELIDDIGIRPILYSLHHWSEDEEIIRQSFMNVLLFYPGGLCLYASLSGSSRKWVFFFTVLILMVLSIVIEALQYHLGIGWLEGDDILYNTVGAFLGAATGWMGEKVRK